MTDFAKFLVRCVVCRSRTTRRHAQAHDGKCKSCVSPHDRALSWSQRDMFARRSADGRKDCDAVLELGYEVYAAENGFHE